MKTRHIRETIIMSNSVKQFLLSLAVTAALLVSGAVAVAVHLMLDGSKGAEGKRLIRAHKAVPVR